VGLGRAVPARRDSATTAALLHSHPATPPTPQTPTNNTPPRVTPGHPHGAPRGIGVLLPPQKTIWVSRSEASSRLPMPSCFGASAHFSPNFRAKSWTAKAQALRKTRRRRPLAGPREAVDAWLSADAAYSGQQRAGYADVPRRAARGQSARQPDQTTRRCRRGLGPQGWLRQTLRRRWGSAPKHLRQDYNPDICPVTGGGCP
jgi:hypothetical protein